MLQNHDTPKQVLLAQVQTEQRNQDTPFSDFPLNPLMIGGIIVLSIMFYYGYRDLKTRRKRQALRKRYSQRKVDWYQEEFGCTPLSESSSTAPTSSVSDRKNTQSRLNASHIDPLPSLEADKIPENSTLRDRYTHWIEVTTRSILLGQYQVRASLQKHLLTQIDPGRGEVFERCLLEAIHRFEYEKSNTSDELKLARVERRLRALNLIQDIWLKHRQSQQLQQLCDETVSKLVQTQSCDRLLILLRVLDSNPYQVFNGEDIETLASALASVDSSEAPEDTVSELHNIATGLTNGVKSYRVLEPHLVSWIYDNPNQLYVGFTARLGIHNPWEHWQRYLKRPLLQRLFESQAKNQSLQTLAQSESSLDISEWVELIISLRGIHHSLVTWFDKQAYSSKFGQDLSAATYMTFAIIWCELSNGFKAAEQLSESDRVRWSQACFQMMLQTFRAFAQRQTFPLYKGIFASFSGEGYRETISYLDQPLNDIKNLQEKARLLTVLGYSQHSIHNFERSHVLLNEALDLAQQAGDQPCAIAALNHLCRLALSQRDFNLAVDYAQRALLQARQVGDRQGEINGMANLGFAEVRRIQNNEQGGDLILEEPIQRLEAGTTLAKKHQEHASHCLCQLGLGIANVHSGRLNQAKVHLNQGLDLAKKLRREEWRGLCHVHLAEVEYQSNQISSALLQACLGMYFLERVKFSEWKDMVNLIHLIRGKLGESDFAMMFDQLRSPIMARINRDGYIKVRSLITANQDETAH